MGDLEVVDEGLKLDSSFTVCFKSLTLFLLEIYEVCIWLWMMRPALF